MERKSIQQRLATGKQAIKRIHSFSNERIGLHLLALLHSIRSRNEVAAAAMEAAHSLTHTAPSATASYSLQMFVRFCVCALLRLCLCTNNARYVTNDPTKAKENNPMNSLRFHLNVNYTMQAFVCYILDFCQCLFAYHSNYDGKKILTGHEMMKDSRK